MTWHLGGVVGVLSAITGLLWGLNAGVIDPTLGGIGKAYLGLCGLGLLVHRLSPYPALTDRLQYRQDWGLSRQIKGETA